jgi:hypothetical protein
MAIVASRDSDCVWLLEHRYISKKLFDEQWRHEDGARNRKSDCATLC